jgi:DNA ligase-1
VKRLLTGELRHALAGLMVDAVAKAAVVPAALVRRALMLSGDFMRTAEVALGEEGFAASASSCSGRSFRCSRPRGRAWVTRS